MTDSPQSKFWRPCSACGQPVHCRSKECKACNAPSPWQDSEQPADLMVAPTPQKPRIYIADREFGCMIGISLRLFQEGEIIDDQELVRQLLAEDCPIRAKSDDDQTVECPHCHKMFLFKGAAAQPQFSPEVAEKIRRLGVA